jgi:hypothetical protein
VEQRAAVGVAQVEGDAARAPVERLVVEAIVRRRVVVGRHDARLVAARRVLDLDDVGAEVGEEHEAERRCRRRAA